MNIVEMIKCGYKICYKYCIIKIDANYYVQKKRVLMGADFAPNFSNLSLLTHLIQNKIYKYKPIKLNLRMINDTLIIINCNYKDNIDSIFEQFYPKFLKFTSENIINNTIKFLNIKLIIIHKSIQYIMQIKELKLEFFTSFDSNHPMHIKINIIQNMVKRAVILSSNKTLFFHTFIALRIRFQRSGYPNEFLLKYMNLNEYENRNKLIKKLKYNRINKLNSILNQNEIKYKPTWVPMGERNYISMLYDNMLITTSSYKYLKSYIREKYPRKMIIPEMIIQYRK